MNRKSSSTNRYRLIAMAVFVAAVITACPNPDQMMDARISDFLGDLSGFEEGATAANDSLAETIVNRHIHPDADDADAALSPAYWETSSFDPFDATDYTWSMSSSAESGEYGGTNERTGSVAITRPGGDGTISVVFFMKQNGADWLIRAIDDGDGSSRLLENIR